jgi:hypothetical protein
MRQRRTPLAGGLERTQTRFTPIWISKRTRTVLLLNAPVALALLMCTSLSAMSEVGKTRAARIVLFFDFFRVRRRTRNY